MVDELSFGLRTAHASTDSAASVQARSKDSALALDLDTTNTTDGTSVLGLGLAAIDLAVDGLHGGPQYLQGATNNGHRTRALDGADYDDYDSASRLTAHRGGTLDVAAARRGRRGASGGLRGIDEDSSWEDSSCEDRMGSSWPDSSNAKNRVYSSDGRGCSSRMDSNCEGSNCVDRECVTEGRDPHSDLIHEQLNQLTQLIQAQGWEQIGQQVTIAVVRKQLEEQQLKFERQMAGLEADQLGWYVHQPHCRCMLCTLQLEQRERARDGHGKIQHLPQPRGAAREQR
jgi:hypothetical protein